VPGNLLDAVLQPLFNTCPVKHLVVDNIITIDDEADHLDEPLQFDFLRAVRRRTGVHGVQKLLGVIVSRQHDDPHWQPLGDDLTHDLHAVHNREVNVKERDVRLLGSDNLQRFLAIPPFAYRDNIVDQVQVGFNTLPENQVIVNDHNRNRRTCSCRWVLAHSLPLDLVVNSPYPNLLNNDGQSTTAKMHQQPPNAQADT